MELDFANKLTNMNARWKDAYFLSRKRFTLFGPKGSGKTRIAQDFARSHKNVFYLSFEYQTPETALAQFCRMYLPEHEDIHNWDDAVKAFLAERRSGLKLIIFEDEQNDAMEQCRAAFHSGKGGMRNLVFCSISRSSKHTDRNNVEANYLTITDVCKCFPAYAKQDAVRLQALTGGIPAILKELDAEANYSQNVRRLLSYDSAFSTLLPQWLKDCFRSPESYYPILKSISFGHHRLSEIAKEIGFPNNKCGKYLEALIEHNFVRADKPHDGKYSTYHIANSYFSAWCRYVYGKKPQQIMTPDALFDFVGQDIDNSLALPAFHNACLRYLQSVKYELYSRLNSAQPKEIKKSVPVTLKDGSEVILDYCVLKKGDALFCVFPHSLAMRYTKDEMERIYEAVQQYERFYNAHIVVFSLERFSDWCVHEASVNSQLYLVTAERMKY